MTTVGLLLKPLDVLLFRDARPFESGDTGRTQWPSPATFAGLMRTHLMSFAGIAPGDLHGLHALPREHRPWFGQLRFRGPWLYVERPHVVRDWNARNGQAVDVAAGPLVAVPTDLMRLGKRVDAEVARLRPLDEPNLPGWTPPLPDLSPMWLPPQVASTKAEVATGWLDQTGLRSYLTGDVPAKSDIHGTETFAVREERTGIGIHTDRFTADQEHGLIYSASFWRLAPGVCFYAEMEWPDHLPNVPVLDEVFPLGTALPWGGEQRRVAIEFRRDETGRIEAYDWKSLEPVAPNGHLLTVLVTPGMFSNGTHRWKPLDQGTLRAACVPKPLPVSGWDLAGVAENGHQPRPRPTRFAVPAGAVYLWSRGARHADDVPARGLRSLCDKPQDADNGWGLALSGLWKPCALAGKE